MARRLPKWFHDMMAFMEPVRTEKHFKAWAIHLGPTAFELKEPNLTDSYTGHGYLGGNAQGILQTDKERGYRIALWRTRREARTYYKSAKSLKANWPRSRVVKVIVGVEPMT